MPAQSLPLDISEISAAWLSQALSLERPGTTVEAVQVRRIIWGTATKVFLDVTYAVGSDSTGLPARLCVKGGFRPELRPIMGTGYQTEALFYRDIAPKLPTEVPHCYYSAVDQDADQGIVVLEDLSDGTFVDARRPLAVDQVATALEVLARWHSLTDLTQPWLTRAPHYRPMVEGLFRPEHWDTYIAQPNSDVVHDLLADRDRIHRAVRAVWAAEDTRPHSMIHGDANATNLYLTPDGHPQFLDWQFACLGDWVHDVSLFVIGALTIEDRRRHEEPLIRGYLDARKRRGTSAPSWDSTWAAYRRGPLHGAMYALTPEEMQPADVRAALADRYAQAAVDHDTLRLLPQ